jgi:hypothetical protein
MTLIVASMMAGALLALFAKALLLAPIAAGIGLIGLATAFSTSISISEASWIAVLSIVALELSYLLGGFFAPHDQGHHPGPYRLKPIPVKIKR